MDFVNGLPVLINLKDETYNPILVIVDKLTKIVYYESIKITINASGLTEVIIDTVVQHYGLLDSIITY